MLFWHFIKLSRETAFKGIFSSVACAFAGGGSLFGLT